MKIQNNKTQKPKIDKVRKPKKMFAKKSFGQNFLIDENIINKIVSALDPQVGETIIEIGSGRGALTENLIASGANIIAIELERDMIAVLKEKFGDYENFQLIEKDALKVDFNELINETSNFKLPTSSPEIKLVANLPYYISTAILQKLIEQRECFSEMILMFQKEVVDRITAKTGNSERGFLSVLVEAYLQTEKLFDVPSEAFYPAPKVKSAIVRLIKSENSEIISDMPLFREIVSASFTQKRKTILNNLKNAPPNIKDKLGNIEEILATCGIDSQSRAESIPLEKWHKLLKIIE